MTLDEIVKKYEQGIYLEDHEFEIIKKMIYIGLKNRKREEREWLV